MSETTLPVATPTPVQNPLTVVMTVKSPEAYAELNAILQNFNAMTPEQNPVIQALNAIGCRSPSTLSLV